LQSCQKLFVLAALPVLVTEEAGPPEPFEGSGEVVSVRGLSMGFFSLRKKGLKKRTEMEQSNLGWAENSAHFRDKRAG